MTHIICRATNCLFWEDGVCSSEEIEYEPDAGCLTFQDIGDIALEEEDDEFDWDEEEEDEDDWEEEDDWEDEEWEDEEDDYDF